MSSQGYDDEKRPQSTPGGETKLSIVNKDAVSSLQLSSRQRREVGLAFFLTQCVHQLRFILSL